MVINKIKRFLYNFFTEIDYLPDNVGIMTLLSLMLPGITLVYSGHIGLTFLGMLWVLALTFAMVKFREGKFDPQDNKDES